MSPRTTSKSAFASKSRRGLISIQSPSGELLLDQQRFSEAVEKFDRAIEIERKKYVFPSFSMTRILGIGIYDVSLYRTPINVLPIVNKALAVYQWQQDLPTAERLLKEALEIDPECDSALATLAQLTLQQGNLEESIELFGRHADIARTEGELEQALTFKFVRLLITADFDAETAN